MSGGLVRPRLQGADTVNKLIFAAIAALALAGTAVASEDTKVFETKQGKVTFHHKEHQDKLKDCKICHATDKGGKIEGWSKDKAHGLCKKCHEEKKAGPTKCADCHKK
jgi:mono/diheme cytochrome c family protein